MTDGPLEEVAKAGEQQEPEPGAVYHVFSPSQVETFVSCPRKWGFGRIAREPRIEHASAALGTEVHTELENHLSGKALDFTHPKGAGYIAASGLHLIPSPDPTGLSEDEQVERILGIQIETEFRFQSARTRFVWNGRKDLELDESSWIPGLAEDNGLPVDERGRTNVPAVLDHKSTSNMRWAKTSEDLEWDVQANLYAYALMIARRVLVVDLAWVYYQTKGAKAAKRTHFRVTWEHAKRAFRLIEDIAKPMAAALDGKPSADDGPPDLRGYVRKSLLPNTDACEKYGGCPYQSACQLTWKERMSATMSDKTDTSFFASLAERAAAEDSRATPAASAPPSVMGCAPESVPAPAGIPAWMLGGSGSDPAPVASVPAPVPGVGFPHPEVAEVEAKTQAKIDTFVASVDSGINPPESSEENAPAALSFLPPPPAPTPVVASEPEAPKAKRGRPAGSKNKSTKDPVGADAMAHATPAPVVDAYEAEIAKVTKELEAAAEESIEATATMVADTDRMAEELTKDALGPILYVDCAPVNVHVEPCESIIARAKAKLAATPAVDKDGRSVTYSDYRFMPFGHGAAALVANVLELVDAERPQAITLSTRTPEGALVLSDLVARASFVIRATS